MTVAKQGLGTEKNCFITEIYQSKNKSSSNWRRGKGERITKIYDRKGIWVPLKGSRTLYPKQGFFCSSRLQYVSIANSGNSQAVAEVGILVALAN